MDTTENNIAPVAEAPAPKVQLTISMILQHLKDGMTRDDIGTKYGLNKAQVKILFRHPKLKFKKTILPKDLPFELTDDTEEEKVEAKEVPVVDLKELAKEDAHSQRGVDIVDDTKGSEKTSKTVW